MIPYELIVPSASRPHLLEPTLRSLLARVDQPPARIILHDDAVFPGRLDAVVAAIGRVREAFGRPAIVFHHAAPPRRHGPALAWLLSQVRTEYVLYAQDDHEAVRDLPVADALVLLDAHGLNQIRFNKRDTMDKKGPEGHEFYKVEHEYTVPDESYAAVWSGGHPVTLCAADHWYFQCGVWRVAAIKPVVDWWMAHPERGDFREHMEVKVNQVFNGQWRGVAGPFPDAVPVLRDEQGAWNDSAVRAGVMKTFIWGRVGEPAFVRHLGGDPKDWALKRDNRDPR